MSNEPPELKIIREALETLVDPTTASTLIYQAIREQRVPKNGEQMLELVRGPLAEAVKKRLDAEVATLLVQRLMTMLGAEESSTSSRHNDITRSVHIRAGATPVFVLSAVEEFGARLTQAVGAEFMTHVPVPDEETLSRRLRRIAPSFVVVDASQFPSIEPSDLVKALQGLEADAVKAVWGVDLPYGLGVLDEALSAGVQVTPFDRAEGMAPLVDMIRARHAAP